MYKHELMKPYKTSIFKRLKAKARRLQKKGITFRLLSMRGIVA